MQSARICCFNGFRNHWPNAATRDDFFVSWNDLKKKKTCTAFNCKGSHFLYIYSTWMLPPGFRVTQDNFIFIGGIRGERIACDFWEVRSFLPQSGKLLYARIPKGGFFFLHGWLAWKQVGEIYSSEVSSWDFFGGIWKERFVGYSEMVILLFLGLKKWD